jgi:hypothetical protein
VSRSGEISVSVVNARGYDHRRGWQPPPSPGPAARPLTTTKHRATTQERDDTVKTVKTVQPLVPGFSKWWRRRRRALRIRFLARCVLAGAVLGTVAFVTWRLV